MSSPIKNVKCPVCGLSVYASEGKIWRHRGKAAPGMSGIATMPQRGQPECPGGGMAAPGKSMSWSETGGTTHKRSHSTMKTEEPTHRILARWESRSGKHWVVLEQHDSVTIANRISPAIAD